jgi:hypothetical protein
VGALAGGVALLGPSAALGFGFTQWRRDAFGDHLVTAVDPLLAGLEASFNA